jgi:hypothetical protein
MIIMQATYSNYGRDQINIGTLFNSSEDSFFELSIDSLKNQNFKSPDITPSLVQKLSEERLLVLGGNLGIDKSDLAIDLVVKLFHNLQTTNKECVIKQWRRSQEKDYVSLRAELQSVKTSTIFVLLDIQPSHIERLHGIHQAVKQSCHYVLITTEISFTTWHVFERDKNTFFPNLAGQIHFTPDLLQQDLEQALRKSFEAQGFNLGDETIQNQIDSKFRSLLALNRQILGEISQKLGTPGKITRFVELCTKKVYEFHSEFHNNKDQQDLRLRDQELSQLIDDSINDERFINALFHDVLNEREKLLALGLSFFNGLYEDQVFAALERIVKEVWQERDPSLRALDYGDLEKLKDDLFRFVSNSFFEKNPPAFRIIQTEPFPIDIRLIKLLSTKDRAILFKVSWETHQRQIRAAMQVLVQLVIDSVSPFAYTQWELYGDRSRRDKLRSVISETLSDIGLASPNALRAVQGNLMQLARHPEFEVRQVAAEAIAHWYAENTKRAHQAFQRTLQLFYSFVLEKDNVSTLTDKLEWEQTNFQDKTLTEKLSESQNLWNKIVAQVSLLLLRLQGKQLQFFDTNVTSYVDINFQRSDITFIGATVAQVLGITIRDSSEPNKLPKFLLEWLQELSESNLRNVLTHLGYFTLYWTIPLHLRQISGAELVSHDDLIDLLKKVVQKEIELKDTFSRRFNYQLQRNAPHRFYDSPLRLSYAVARSLAYTYENGDYQGLIQEILTDWEAEATQSYDDGKDKHEVKRADALVRCIAFTYGLIEYSDQTPLTLGTALAFLKKQFSRSKVLHMRGALLFTLLSILYRYFQQVADDQDLEKQLQKLVVMLKTDEQHSLIDVFQALYLEQRATPRNEIEMLKQAGNRFIGIEGRYYLIYKDPASSERPTLPIEAMLNRWAKSETPSLQTIALQSLLVFVKSVESKQLFSGSSQSIFMNSDQEVSSNQKNSQLDKAMISESTIPQSNQNPDQKLDSHEEISQSNS